MPASKLLINTMAFAIYIKIDFTLAKVRLFLTTKHKL